MKRRILSMLLCSCMLFGCMAMTGCGKPAVPAYQGPEYERDIIVYFANWYLDSKTAEQGAEVCSIPWDQITYVNHAFWEVQPADGSTETSFARREQGKPARTAFKIASTQPDMDFDNQEPSTMAEGLPRNHFAQYAAYSEKYPHVNILISIGGWTRCGYFSEMAYTPEGRTSFVKACMDLMETYPWIDGIDIDWEYFGGSKDGERKPEDDNDQGCPIWGTVDEDSENFAALAKELRETMDEKYGAGVKKLTGCASASTGWTLPMQKWQLVEPYMDRINIMSYDMAGMWDHVTGNASTQQHAKDAVTIMNLGRGIDFSKLCIGTPMYATDFKLAQPLPEGVTEAVRRPIEPTPPADYEIDQTMVRAWEAEAVSGYRVVTNEKGKLEIGETFDQGGVGWHMGYDKLGRGSYLYNDDPNSEYYLWYLSYETPLTLQDKLDLIEEKELAGIIIWESSEDTADHQMIGQMADRFVKTEENSDSAA